MDEGILLPPQLRASGARRLSQLPLNDARESRRGESYATNEHEDVQMLGKCITSTPKKEERVYGRKKKSTSNRTNRLRPRST